MKEAVCDKVRKSTGNSFYIKAKKNINAEQKFILSRSKKVLYCFKNSAAPLLARREQSFFKLQTDYLQPVNRLFTIRKQSVYGFLQKNKI